MTSWMTRAVVGATLALMTQGALAQPTSDNLVATKTDWSVFTEENPKECWGVQQPQGNREHPRRQAGFGQARRYPAVRDLPAGAGGGETSFTGGYPFAPGSKVELNVDGTSSIW